jgi:class 3 adenylate cyclase
MEEFADKRRRELTPEQLRNGSSLAENPVDEAGRIRVYFTRSQQPQEKDLLIEKYKELFDVGRAEKAHELVFGALLKMGSEVPQLALCEVQASRFGQVEDAAEVGRWQHLRDQLQRGLVFQGRGHEVAIEHFDPKTTPIIITDSKVDSEQVRQLREQLAGLASMGGLGDKLMEFLGNLEKRGGSLIIHVNARNEMMVRLRDSLMASQSEVRCSAADGLSLIAWRAVIDYFGWTSSRDMMARDRENAHLIIRNLLAASTDSSALRKQIDDLQGVYNQTLTEKSRLEQQVAELTLGTSEPRTVEGLCGFVDFVDSTKRLMANPNAKPEDRWELFRLLTDELVAQIDSFGGETIVFTGDGVLFIVEEKKKKGNVGANLGALSGSMKAVLGRPGVAREILNEMGETPPSLRIGVSSGKFSIGRIGPTINAVGLPIVQASRIANDNALMGTNGTNLLVSQTAVNYGAKHQMWEATAFEEAGVHQGKGLHYEIKVYMLKNER